MATAAPPLIDVALAGARGVGLCPGDRVVVGVSAGADSTALACLLRALAAHGLPLDLVLVYVDHGWRGPAAAEADAAAVEALGQRLGVPVRRSPPPPPEVPQTEDAARRHRYVELTRAAQAVGATVVAVAHHLGDQAETLVMRAMRGSGPYGVAGMPARRRLGDAGIQLVRPLLAVHPDALRAWLESHSVSWREDPSNADTSHDRAAVRARLRRYAARHGDPRAHLAALADRFRRRIEVRDERIANRIVKVLHTYPFAGAVRAPRRALAELDRGLDLELGLRVMGRAIHADRHGPWLTRRVIHAVHDAMQDGGAVDLPRGLRVHVAGKHAWLTWRTQPKLGIPVPRVDVVDLADASFSHSAQRAVLDADVLGAAPTLRLLRNDDAFVPFGSTSGRARNVVRWLSKQGVPALARRGVLVLEGNAGVAWVVGERIDARHAITPRSRCAARVQLPDD